MGKALNWLVLVYEGVSEALFSFLRGSNEARHCICCDGLVYFLSLILKFVLGNSAT